MDAETVSRVTAVVADAIHEEWQVLFRAQNPGVFQRWKPALSADNNKLRVTPDQFHEWVAENAAGKWYAFRYAKDGVETAEAGGVFEVDILALPNSLLPPGNAAENTASARTAVEALLSEGKPSVTSIATKVHDAWKKRNESWAPEDQKKEYHELTVEEQLKDVAIVAIAHKECKKAGLV